MGHCVMAWGVFLFLLEIDAFFQTSLRTIPWHLPMFPKILFVVFAATFWSHLHIPFQRDDRHRTQELRQCVCHQQLMIWWWREFLPFLVSRATEGPDCVVLTWHQELCFNNKGLSTYCSCHALQCCHLVSPEWLQYNSSHFPFHQTSSAQQSHFGVALPSWEYWTLSVSQAFITLHRH